MKQSIKYEANLYGIKYPINEAKTHIKYGGEWLIFAEEDGYLRIMVDGAIVDFDIESKDESKQETDSLEWEIIQSRQWGNRSDISNAGKRLAVIEHYTEDKKDEIESLINAAPDMYRALKIVLWDMENGEAEAQRQGKPRYSERKEIILAAINKATPKK